MLSGKIVSGGMITATIDNNGDTPKGSTTVGVIDRVEIKQFSSLYAFPNLGNEHYLYVDKDMNKTYRWDNSLLQYICVGSDYEQINVIEGGTANE